MVKLLLYEALVYVGIGAFIMLTTVIFAYGTKDADFVEFLHRRKVWMLIFRWPAFIGSWLGCMSSWLMWQVVKRLKW